MFFSLFNSIFCLNLVYLVKYANVVYDKFVTKASFGFGLVNSTVATPVYSHLPKKKGKPFTEACRNIKFYLETDAKVVQKM